jgi:acetyl esterase/lipase
MRTVALLLLLTLLSQPVAGQPKKHGIRAPKPTVANFKYGKDSDRQVLDFWQAESEKPTPVVVFIHGGGWRGGDKALHRQEVNNYLDAGISAAAINYRFIDQAMEQKVEPPVKAPLHDAARAIQTIRSKAKEWNIDPERVAATGGSAGACTSLWLAFHDDLADPESDDPVARQSTRLTCAAVVGAQTSLDSKQVREWISNAEYGGHAFGFLVVDGQAENRRLSFSKLMENRDKVMPWIKEYSPIELVSSDDPPIYMSYPAQKTPPAHGQEEKDPTHAAMYGVKLAERLRDAGIEVVLTYPAEPESKYGSPTDFIIEKLGGNSASVSDDGQ